MTQKADWRDGFLFVGNNLALDFVNTCPVQDGKRLELLPDFPALLRWFQAAQLLTPREVSSLECRWRNSPKARQAYNDILQFRELLRSEILHWEAHKPIRQVAIAEINHLLFEHPMLKRLKADRGVPEAELYFDAKEPGDLFAPLAHHAATLFSTTDRTRVRKCRRCILHFHDISKKGTRQWCSMQLCGNRVKVAAYAARKRSASA